MPLSPNEIKELTNKLVDSLGINDTPKRKIVIEECLTAAYNIGKIDKDYAEKMQDIAGVAFPETENMRIIAKHTAHDITSLPPTTIEVARNKIEFLVIQAIMMAQLKENQTAFAKTESDEDKNLKLLGLDSEKIAMDGLSEQDKIGYLKGNIIKSRLLCNYDVAHVFIEILAELKKAKR